MPKRRRPIIIPSETKSDAAACSSKLVLSRNPGSVPEDYDDETTINLNEPSISTLRPPRLQKFASRGRTFEPEEKVYPRKRNSRGSYGGMGAAYGFVNDHCFYQDAARQVDIVKPSQGNVQPQMNIIVRSPELSHVFMDRMGHQPSESVRVLVTNSEGTVLGRPGAYQTLTEMELNYSEPDMEDVHINLGEPLLLKECMTPTEVCHLLVFPELIPRDKVCRCVPQGYKAGDATFIIDNSYLKSVDDISSDGLGSWKRPSGKTRYLAILNQVAKKATFLDKDGRLEQGVAYDVRVVRSRSENKNAKLARTVFKAYNENKQPMPYSAITYHWSEQPHDFNILPHGNSKRSDAKPFQPKPRSFLNELRMLKNMTWDELEREFEEQQIPPPPPTLERDYEEEEMVNERHRMQSFSSEEISTEIVVPLTIYKA